MEEFLIETFSKFLKNVEIIKKIIDCWRYLNFHNHNCLEVLMGIYIKTPVVQAHFSPLRACSRIFHAPWFVIKLFKAPTPTPKSLLSVSFHSYSPYTKIH